MRENKKFDVAFGTRGDSVWQQENVEYKQTALMKIFKKRGLNFKSYKHYRLWIDDIVLRAKLRQTQDKQLESSNQNIKKVLEAK
jgi:hypothetical protein